MRKAKRELCEILSSCEMIDKLSLDLVTGHLKLRSPIEEHPFYMLVETHGSNNTHDEEKMNAFLENAMAEGLVVDGTTTNEPGKMQVRFYTSSAGFHLLVCRTPVAPLTPLPPPT